MNHVVIILTNDEGNADASSARNNNSNTHTTNMASIEVSLSTAQRRKNAKKNANGSVTNVSKTPSINVTAPASIFASIRSNTLIDTCRELEVLRNALKDKENTIQNLQGQINGCGRIPSFQPLDPAERRSAELRLQTLKQEEESRKSAIKKINLNLEQIDANEANIDVRIKQAELEYELGREELGLLGVREELRTLQARLDAKPSLTLYSSINSSGKYTLHCVQLEYDPKSPRFGAGNVDDKIGLFVLWAGENSGLQKGDRILEVNGKLTLGTSKEELLRLLTVCPSKTEIVLLRTWTPPSTEEFLRRENLRLTHRISYLEDQVSELMRDVPSKEVRPEEKDTEIYQKGCHVALLANGKPGNKLQNSVKPRENGIEDENEDTRHSGDLNNSNKNTNSVMVSVNGYHVPLGPLQKYHEVDNYHSSQYKSFCFTDKVKKLTQKYENDDFTSRSGWVPDENYHKKSFAPSPNYKNGSASDNLYSLSDMERSSRKSGHNRGRVVDYSSETSYQRYKSLGDKKMETDEESGCAKKSELSESESGRIKPTPPKKPIRLSINRATSLQNVEMSGYTIQSAMRKIKRSHKSEAPPPPILQENKLNGSQHSMSDLTGIRKPVKSEFWNHTNHHRSMNRIDEKWC
ncbi:hypothetical protein RUM44_008563 [Polyplax serrata]|uniref:PDZ domain-containing protein n=1 Tax=Polyplax serrata TaxID=468196 RepID=A0ABR1B8L0_POLSC